MLKNIAAVLALLACLIAGWTIWPRVAPEEPAQPDTRTGSRPASLPAPAVAESPTGPASRPDFAQKPIQMIRLPDGQLVPPLNGMTEAPPLNWPSNRPYARILGKEVDTQGQEWYVHADGTKWTTQMAWRSDLRRRDAATLIAEPVPTIPLEPRTQQMPTGPESRAQPIQR